MFHPEMLEELAPRARVQQTIVVALTMGLAVMLGLSLALESRVHRPQVDGEAPVLSYVAVALALGTVPLRVFFPDVLVREGRRRLVRKNSNSNADADAQGLLALGQTRTIVGAALLEGPASFALAAYMVDGEPIVVVFAIALMIGVAAHFPTVSSLQQWLEAQLRVLNQERASIG